MFRRWSQGRCLVHGVRLRKLVLISFLFWSILFSSISFTTLISHNSPNHKTTPRSCIHWFTPKIQTMARSRLGSRPGPRNSMHGRWELSHWSYHGCLPGFGLEGSWSQSWEMSPGTSKWDASIFNARLSAYHLWHGLNSTSMQMLTKSI